MTLVLDTNAYSDWRRFGHWGQRIAVAERIVIPSIVLGELEFGFINGNRCDVNRQKLMDFLEHPLVEIATINHRTARIYAQFYSYLRSKGRPIPVNDIWIAAISDEVGGELAARDGHFDELPMLVKARDMGQ
jgi:tRNA(fMet)-specific endonuclease VapC